METLYDRLSDMTRDKIDQYPYPTSRRILIEELKSKTNANEITLDGAITLLVNVLNQRFDVCNFYDLFKKY